MSTAELWENQPAVSRATPASLDEGSRCSLSNYVVSSEAIREDGLEQIGRKALGLWRVSQGGFNVPEFFVVGTPAWDSVCLPIVARHSADLDQAPRLGDARLNELAETLASAITRIEMPPGLVRECRDAMRSRGLTRVAVRSSAVAEDEATRSFAGIYDSFLNVAAESVSATIARCWASAFSRRSLKYRDTLGDISQFRMAVIVQRMVDCDVAAVVFTVDPVKRRHVLVESIASQTPEAIVHGTRTPTRFLFSRQLDLIERSPDGDETPVSVGRTLAALGLKIEQALGSPQDIECGLANGAEVVFQSRPISTLT